MRALNVRPHTATVAVAEVATGGHPDLVGDAVELLVVDGDHTIEQIEVITRLASNLQQRPRIFRKTVVGDQATGRDHGVIAVDLDGVHGLVRVCWW